MQWLLRGCSAAVAAALSVRICAQPRPLLWVLLLHAPAAATRAGSSASRAMATSDTKYSKIACGSPGHITSAAQKSVGRTVKGCRAQGEGTDAWKGRCVHCQSRRERNAQYRPSGTVEQMEVRAHLTRSSLP